MARAPTPVTVSRTATTATTLSAHTTVGSHRLPVMMDRRRPPLTAANHLRRALGWVADAGARGIVGNGRGGWCGHIAA